MTKSVKNRKNVMKYNKKKRITYNQYKKIKNRNNLISVGGGKEEQDLYIENTFEIIKIMNIEELNKNLKKLCVEFNNNIVNAAHFEFTINIRSYLVINMLAPFLYEYVYSEENAPHDKLNTLDSLTSNGVFLGSEIKENNLISLSPYPEKSLELLNSCKDDEYYCVMNPKYIIADYRLRDYIKYYCDSNDMNKIKRITTNKDLQNVKDGPYHYSILPNKTLCLFQGSHSAGSCGQPVICAGMILIEKNRIKKIENSSGHYSPPYYMLTKALHVLQTQGLITSNENEDKSKSAKVICTCTFVYL
jgi:hypothetical protein